MIAQSGSRAATERSGPVRLHRVFRRYDRGHSVIEFALLSPWILLLFLGIFDFGYYAYALINVENAARAAARNMVETYSYQGALAIDCPGNTCGTGTNVDVAACTAALKELRSLPNISSGVNTCVAAPLLVNATPRATVACPGAINVSNNNCVEVEVDYRTVTMIPIPGLSGQLRIRRFVYEAFLY